MQLFEDRRNLHRIPELGRELPKTTQYLQNSLKNLSCRVFAPVPGALCAFFDVGAKESIAFRADMDALPVEEKTGLPFASNYEGAMHACGHDGHMAILLELARRLNRLPADKNVLLIFQPDEEGSGGAKDICQSGLLEECRVQAIFGLHLWPGLEKGKLYSRKGEMMSRSCEVTVTFTGKSAHIGKAEDAIDALAACAAFYTQAVQMERSLPSNVFRLLKFGKMRAGSVRNVIADSARLEGSLRTFDDGVYEMLKENLRAIAAIVEKTTGCAAEVAVSEGYPAVCNAEEVWEKVNERIPVCHLERPTIITEDFSWYQRYVPGMFFFLGLGDTPALHASKFDFDEEVLLSGADLFEKLAREYE